jgi:hypothetical protein
VKESKNVPTSLQQLKAKSQNNQQACNSLNIQDLIQTKGTIIPQVGMIINIYYNDVALSKSLLSGGPTKAS